MEVKTYEQLIRYLLKEAANHIAYYHYTRWECLAKMMASRRVPNLRIPPERCVRERVSQRNQDA